jgi:hypothetical protein
MCGQLGCQQSLSNAAGGVLGYYYFKFCYDDSDNENENDTDFVL